MGHLAVSGGILFVITGSKVDTGAAASHPAMYRTVSMMKNDLFPNVNSVVTSLAAQFP